MILDFDLPWSKECLISKISITPALPGKAKAKPTVLVVAALQTTGAKFQINNAKLYVPIVTFSINDSLSNC